MNSEYNDEPVAFDMGVSTIMRINYWLWRCNSAQENNDVSSWFKALKILYKETYTFIGSSADREANDNKLKEIELAYKEYLQHENNYLNQRAGRKAPFRPKRDIFDGLFNWERDLRTVLDKEGLLMRRGESAGSAILRT